uniref:Uncharacterized protein n=1 Tax=Anopheles darlingi TaxID=43151 RepID=A0A2M4DRL2_ANODA
MHAAHYGGEAAIVVSLPSMAQFMLVVVLLMGSYPSHGFMVRFFFGGIIAATVSHTHATSDKQNTQKKPI